MGECWDVKKLSAAKYRIAAIHRCEVRWTAEGDRAVGWEGGAASAQCGLAFDDVELVETAAGFVVFFLFARRFLGVFDEDVVGAPATDEFAGLALAHLDGLRRVYERL